MEELRKQLVFLSEEGLLVVMEVEGASEKVTLKKVFFINITVCILVLIPVSMHGKVCVCRGWGRKETLKEKHTSAST